MYKIKILIGSVYYKKWEGNSQHLKPSTLKQYKQGLKKFEKFLIQNGLTSEVDFNNFYFDEKSESYFPVDEEFIDEFINHLKNSDSTDSVLYYSISSLKNFFLFLYNSRLISINPMASQKNPYYHRGINCNKALSEIERLNILAAAKKR